MIKGYGEKVKTQLAKICNDILDALDKHPTTLVASWESMFHHKM